MGATPSVLGRTSSSSHVQFCGSLMRPRAAECFPQHNKMMLCCLEAMSPAHHRPGLLSTPLLSNIELWRPFESPSYAIFTKPWSIITTYTSHWYIRQLETSSIFFDHFKYLSMLDFFCREMFLWCESCDIVWHPSCGAYLRALPSCPSDTFPQFPTSHYRTWSYVVTDWHSDVCPSYLRKLAVVTEIHWGWLRSSLSRSTSTP